MSAPSAPFVRAVVLNWNGGTYVLDAVEALLRTRWPADRFRVVVVDNASTDGSDREIERRFPVVDLRRSPTNGGFPANNLALGDLDGVDYVALVNNDAFVEPDWLAPLVAAAEAEGDLGAVCPKLVFAPRFAALDVVCAGPSSPQVWVSGVEVAGVERWRYAWFGPGWHAQEADPSGGDERDGAASAERAQPRARRKLESQPARIGLPVIAPLEAPARCRVRLAADEPTVLTLREGAASRVASVGPEPTWHDVDAVGETFDVVQNLGSLLLEGGYGADRGFQQVDDGRWDEPAEVFSWCGGGVLLRPAYLAEVGLFDERLFMYYEDTDLAWRGRASGWRYRAEPASRIRHLHATSSVVGSARFDHFVERNRLAVLTKNAPSRVAARAVAVSVRELVAMTRHDLGAARARRRPPTLPAARRRARTLGAYAAMLPALLRERSRLRRRQRVADAEILAWMQPRSVHPF